MPPVEIHLFRLCGYSQSGHATKFLSLYMCPIYLSKTMLLWMQNFLFSLGDRFPSPRHTFIVFLLFQVILITYLSKAMLYSVGKNIHSVQGGHATPLGPTETTSHTGHTKIRRRHSLVSRLQPLGRDGFLVVFPSGRRRVGPPPPFKWQAALIRVQHLLLPPFTRACQERREREWRRRWRRRGRGLHHVLLLLSSPAMFGRLLSLFKQVVGALGLR